jgi:hypothetical protein
MTIAPKHESEASPTFALPLNTWLDRVKDNPQQLSDNIRSIVIQGMKAHRWKDHSSYEVSLDRRDAACMIAACDLLVTLGAKVEELSEWRNPEVWKALEENPGTENLTLALRHGRAMEARVVVLEKAILEQNKATGLIPSVLAALRSEQTGEKDE